MARPNPTFTTDALGEYLTNVALGNIAGAKVVHKFGRLPDLDAADGFLTVWNGKALYPGHDATAAQVVELFSSSLNDAALGSGARTITVYGLDGNYAEVSETVTLDGVNGVTTVNSYIRMNRGRVRSAGLTGSNEGTITARQSVTTANIFMQLPIAYNSTMIAAYTIPAGKTGYIITAFAAYAKKAPTGSADVHFVSRPLSEVWSIQEEFAIIVNGTSYVQRAYPIPKNGFSEKSDIEVRASTDSNDTAIAAGFDLLLIDN